MEKFEPFLTPLLIAFAALIIYRRYREKLKGNKNQQGTGSAHKSDPDDHYEPYAGHQ